MVYVENNLIDSESGMYLTIDSLIDISNIITASDNITLREVNVKPYGFDEMYMDQELIKEQLLIKYCVEKHLILLKMQNMMDIKEELLE